MPVTYDFRGRTAVVTGGAKGIGRTIAHRLAAAGTQVWVWDVVPIETEGIRYNSVDVTQGNEIAKALADVLRETDRIDILVNNAGYAGGTTRIEEFDPENWRRILEISLTSVLEVSRQVVPHMRLAGWGRIVNMASLAGKEGIPMLSAYAAAKAGVTALPRGDQGRS